VHSPPKLILQVHIYSDHSAILNMNRIEAALSPGIEILWCLECLEACLPTVCLEAGRDPRIHTLDQTVNNLLRD
jgi:hypothetical protein